ncbi:MAG: 5-dehydro-4-deoxy-D-glucuronate isomerase [Bacteroidales bacterium]|nr:5-dehydro-4-deoxy-D-glucuronate isomerase [Bacteroidales bacterium]
MVQNIRYTHHPEDIDNYTTEKYKSEFLIKKLFIPGKCSLVYTYYDRMIVGGIVPLEKVVVLGTMDIQKTPSFHFRRESGIINIGGAGTVSLDGNNYCLDNCDALYIGKGVKHVSFKSDDANSPAKFYLNSALAHAVFPSKLIRAKEANPVYLGAQSQANKRVLCQYIVPNIVDTCQLMMGITTCDPGNVWNTMPCHTHELRMEVYLYFNFPGDESVCHIMGRPGSTRNIWVHPGEAVISPPWSVHTAAGTTNYSFIWGMAGSDSDMDAVLTNTLI